MFVFYVDFIVELRGAETANPSIKRRFCDDDATGFGVVVDKIDVQTCFVVNVIKCMSETYGNLYSRHPCGEKGEVWVVLIAETIRQADTVYEVIDEVDVVAGV